MIVVRFSLPLLLLLAVTTIEAFQMFGYDFGGSESSTNNEASIHDGQAIGGEDATQVAPPPRRKITVKGRRVIAARPRAGTSYAGYPRSARNCNDDANAMCKCEGENGPKGVQGMKGPQGEFGPAGLPGRAGREGEPGEPGETGDRGQRGEKGDKGDSAPGPEGPRGVPGLPGDYGEPGETGPMGPMGRIGDPGPRGPMGEPGKNGKPGERGRDGVKGATGPTGERGPTGPTGRAGEPGKNGEDGADGFKGQTGETGAPGVPGPKGDTGEQGPRGDRGFLHAGQKGATGEKGDKGEPGLDGGKAMQGQKGKRGAKGPKGQNGISIAGDPGERGKVGEDGEPGDMGKRGPRGKAGKPGYAIDGEVGPIGPNGSRGEQGDQGRNGLPGVTGLTGDMGDPGEPGEPGASYTLRAADGDPGETGEKGDKGETGPTGDDGDEGEPGDRGVTGQQGDKGQTGETGDVDCIRPPGPPGDVPFIKGGQLYARHYQDTSIPTKDIKNRGCPSDHIFLWSGYSLLHTEDGGRANIQDLGAAGSCIRTFSPTPFLKSWGTEEGVISQQPSQSYWLSAYTDSDSAMAKPTELLREDAEIKPYISRCSACMARGPVLAFHSQTTEVPTCPSKWKQLWTGYSFVMYTVGRVAGGQRLESPGSCLPDYRAHPFIECNADHTCFFFSDKMSYWLMSNPGTEESKILPSREMRHYVSRCVVCADDELFVINETEKVGHDFERANPKK